ncbi:MAG: hypothetical protein EBS28_01610 [Chlamydiae bacterium]|nr:hypothetical protein [Chlamydiota bacterium]
MPEATYISAKMYQHHLFFSLFFAIYLLAFWDYLLSSFFHKIPLITTRVLLGSVTSTSWVSRTKQVP